MRGTYILMEIGTKSVHIKEIFKITENSEVFHWTPHNCEYDNTITNGNNGQSYETHILIKQNFPLKDQSEI